MKGIRYNWEPAECQGAKYLFGKYVLFGTGCRVSFLEYMVCEVAVSCRVTVMLVPVAAIGVRNRID